MIAESIQGRSESIKQVDETTGHYFGGITSVINRAAVVLERYMVEDWEVSTVILRTIFSAAGTLKRCVRALQLRTAASATTIQFECAVTEK